MTAERVRMKVQWFVAPGEMASIQAALQTLMVATRSEPGCLSCALAAELGERASFRYVEEWRAERDLVVQLQSPRFAKLAHLMESAIERPHVEFELPSGVRGIDYAEGVRGP